MNSAEQAAAANAAAPTLEQPTALNGRPATANTSNGAAGTARNNAPGPLPSTSAPAPGSGPERSQSPMPAPLPIVPDNEEGDGVKLSLGRAKNYAAKDSGAVMLETPAASRGMDNLLVDSRDRYAISPCAEKIWVVMGLSEDILVRTVALSSYEKYSSTVRDFQILASQSFPTAEWLDLGTFTAAAGAPEQTFDLPQPAFARYLKFKFLNHYGSEFYCTLSQIKVFGTTMVESFQKEWEESSAELREMHNLMHHSGAAVAAANGDSTEFPAAVSATGTSAESEPASASIAGSADDATAAAASGARSVAGEVSADADEAAEAAATTAAAREETAAPEANAERSVAGNVAANAAAAAASSQGQADAASAVPAPAAADVPQAPLGSDPHAPPSAVLSSSESSEEAADAPALQEVSAAGGAADVEPEGEELSSLPHSDNVVERVAESELDDAQDTARATLTVTATISASDRAAGVSAESDPVQLEVPLVEGEVAVRGGSGGGNKFVGAIQEAVEAVVGKIKRGGGGNGGNGGGSGSRREKEKTQADAADKRAAISAAASEASDEAAAASGGGGGVTSEPQGRAVEESAAVDQGSDEAAAVEPEVALLSAEVAKEPVQTSEVKDVVEVEVVVATLQQAPKAEVAVERKDEENELSSSATEKQEPSIDEVGEGAVKLATAGAAEPQERAASAEYHAHAKGQAMEEQETCLGGGCEGKGSVAKDSHTPAVAREARDAGGDDAGGMPQTCSGLSDSVCADGGVSCNAGGGAASCEGSASTETNAAAALPTQEEPEEQQLRRAATDSHSEPSQQQQQQQQQREPLHPQALPPKPTTQNLSSSQAGGAASAAGLLSVPSLDAHAHVAAAAAAAMAEPPSAQVQKQAVVTQLQQSMSQAAQLPPPLQVQVAQPASAAAAAAAAAESGQVRWQQRQPVVRFPEGSIVAARSAASACADLPSFVEFKARMLAKTPQHTQQSGTMPIGGQYESIFKTLMNKIKTLEIDQSLLAMYTDSVHGCYRDALDGLTAPTSGGASDGDASSSGGMAHCSGGDCAEGGGLPRVSSEELRLLTQQIAEFTEMVRQTGSLSRSVGGGGAVGGIGGGGQHHLPLGPAAAAALLRLQDRLGLQVLPEGWPLLAALGGVNAILSLAFLVFVCCGRVARAVLGVRRARRNSGSCYNGVCSGIYCGGGVCNGMGDADWRRGSEEAVTEAYTPPPNASHNGFREECHARHYSEPPPPLKPVYLRQDRLLSSRGRYLSSQD